MIGPHCKLFVLLSWGKQHRHTSSLFFSSLCARVHAYCIYIEYNEERGGLVSKHCAFFGKRRVFYLLLVSVDWTLTALCVSALHELINNASGKHITIKSWQPGDRSTLTDSGWLELHCC